jgi:aminomethyltransferase
VNDPSACLRTPLYDLHRELGAKMVPFAGYLLPLHYPTGILKEHRHTRTQAGLFDISHMGQIVLRGDDAVKAMERLTPVDLVGLKDGWQRYGLLLNAKGGIRDDFVAGRLAGESSLAVVVNAATKEKDIRSIARALADRSALRRFDEQALLALQGPAAEAVLKRHVPGIDALAFMQLARVEFDGLAVVAARSGYTGEDGFEISMKDKYVEYVARTLLGEPEVSPVGLGARDALRLEAGLCLYGHDLDETVDPVEAGLAWTIGSRRLLAQDFPAAKKIVREMATGTPRRRVGLRIEGGVPAREGTEIADETGRMVGRVTSGAFSPTFGGPIAMAYLETAAAEVGRIVHPKVRDKALNATVTTMPFVPHRYKTNHRRRS